MRASVFVYRPSGTFLDGQLQFSVMHPNVERNRTTIKTRREHARGKWLVQIIDFLSHLPQLLEPAKQNNHLFFVFCPFSNLKAMKNRESRLTGRSSLSHSLSHSHSLSLTLSFVSKLFVCGVVPQYINPTTKPTQNPWAGLSTFHNSSPHHCFTPNERTHTHKQTEVQEKAYVFIVIIITH